MAGALDGVTVIELAGIGALPFGVLQLADMGAAVIRVERPGDAGSDPEAAPRSSWDRGRRSIAIDLQRAEGRDALVRLAEGADVVCESFRPGVAERLGVGPDRLLAHHPRLVYARLTGWGRGGPRSARAGHSLNYEAMSGLVRAIGPAGGPPVPLLQVLGDFAAGGMQLAYGVVCALFEARRSGRGQVVDVAMLDGLHSLGRVFHLMDELGMLGPRGTNLFDGGAPFYAVYECDDAEYVAVAAIEPLFYDRLVQGLGLDPATLPDQYDRARWPELHDELARVFATRTRDDWARRFEDTDACVTPVLSWTEAREDPQAVARDLYGDDAALRPVPSLSRTPGVPGPAPAAPGADRDAVLGAAGFAAEEISALVAAGVVR